MRNIWMVIVLLVFVTFTESKGQEQQASQETLTDLTNRIMAELQNFQDYASLIAVGSAPEAVRKKGIEMCMKLFAQEAVIQEKSKFSSRERNWKVDQYLWAIFSRGEKTPVILEYEIIDELNVDELEAFIQPDGTVVYRGTMVFKQYYCRLKPVAERSEMTAQEPNVNCAYSDVTEKEVTVEIKRRTSVKGEFWITQFTSVKVLRVY